MVGFVCCKSFCFVVWCKNIWSNPRDRDRVRVEYRDRPAKTEKPKRKQPQNQDSQFKKDVIVGLANLGLTKKDAKTLVNSACSKKEYKTADALFQDCMVLMSEMRT